MENVYFLTDRELKTYLATLEKFSYQGMNGVTYHNDKIVVKYVYKEYHGNVKKLLQFRDERIRDFYFVRAGIYLLFKKKIRCTVSKYAVGEMLLKNDISYVNIDKLIRACDRLEKSVFDLSNVSIRVGDVISSNILYDNECFRFIDTTEYFYSSESVKSIYRQNMKDILNVIYGSIISEYIRPDFKHLLGKDGYMHPAETLYNFRELLLKKGIEFSTFEEANRKLMLRRYL